MHKPSCGRKNNGMSLLEVLVVVLIFSIMATVLLVTYIQGTKIYHLIITQSDLRTVAQSAMDTMVNELKRTTRTSGGVPSPNLVIPSVPNNYAIDFYLPKDLDGNGLIIDGIGNTEWEMNNKIQYQYVAGEHILRRLEKGELRTIANNVQRVEFEDTSINPLLYIDELKIILTLSDVTSDGRTVSSTVCSIVKLRN